jgi:hypothetical protein
MCTQFEEFVCFGIQPCWDFIIWDASFAEFFEDRKQQRGRHAFVTCHLIGEPLQLLLYLSLSCARAWIEAFQDGLVFGQPRLDFGPCEQIDLEQTKLGVALTKLAYEGLNLRTRRRRSSNNQVFERRPKFLSLVDLTLDFSLCQGRRPRL